MLPSGFSPFLGRTSLSVFFALCAVNLIAASNPVWPQPVPTSVLRELSERGGGGAAEPTKGEIFFEVPINETTWFKRYDSPLDDKASAQYEFNNAESAVTPSTESATTQSAQPSTLTIIGHKGRQEGIILAPELWQKAGGPCVLGMEITLTDLDLPTYYLSPHVSQGAGRGDQRWLTNLIPHPTLVEFPVQSADQPIRIGQRGNEGRMVISRLYFRRAKVDDRSPWPVASSPGIRIEIDSQVSLPANPLLFGISPNLFQSSRGFEAPEVRDIIQELGIRTLRFPSGTHANWYEWEHDGWPSPDHLPKGTPAFVGQSSSTLQRLRGTYGLKGYQSLVRDDKISPLLVLNINSATPESQLEWARAMKKAGAETTHFELGNETYHDAQATSHTATGEQYVEWAGRYAKLIRSEFPAARFGVPIESRRIRADGKSWNETVSRAPFADAAILHTYTMMFGIPFNREMAVSLLYPDTQLAEKVLEKRTDFPQLKIWNTEWGLNAPPENPSNSQLRALQTASYLLSLIDWQSDFELATFHCLGAGEFSLAEIRGNAPITVNRAYFSFVLMAPLFDAKSVWLKTTLDGAELAPGYPPATGRAFFNHAGRLCMLLVNKLPVPQPATVVLNHTALHLAGTLRSLSAPALGTSNVVPLHQSLIDSQRIDGKLILPPNSVSLVELTSQ